MLKFICFILLIAAIGAGNFMIVADPVVATREAQANPLFYKMKLLEVERNRIEKWDGQYPRWFMGGGEGANMLFQMPTESDVKSSVITK